MKRLFILATLALAVVSLVIAIRAQAQSFTDLAGNAAYEGKTGIKDLLTAIDANFALVDAGSVQLGDNTNDTITIKGRLRLIQDGVTNFVDTMSGTLDGEVIAIDSIDDDSIDFADVTGADLTLTDCGAITSSGRVQGATIGVGATGTFQQSGTQLLYIVGGVTNVIDSDTGTP